MLKHLKSLALLIVLVAASAMIGSLSAQWLSSPSAEFIEGDYSTQRQATGTDVVLIGTAWCGYCKQTREFLAERGVNYADLDLENSEQAYQWAQS